MSNQIKNFASACVSKYATYNKLDDFYSLSVCDLPDFIKHKFSVLIISEHPDYAVEATGSDNPAWSTKMFPSLLRYLRNYQDNEFQNIWRDCVSNYFLDFMQETIDEELYEFNSDHGYRSTQEEIYGVRAHGSI